MNENLNTHELTEAESSAMRALGALSFAEGRKRIAPSPAALMAAWYKGWDAANIAAPVPGWTAEENAAIAKVGLPERVSREEVMAFAQALMNLIVTEYAQSYPNLPAPVVSVMFGRNNARIVVQDGSSKRVHSFVELATGNILKAEGWDRPARHPRGNIRQGDQSNWWNGAVNSCGARYL